LALCLEGREERQLNECPKESSATEEEVEEEEEERTQDREVQDVDDAHPDEDLMSFGDPKGKWISFCV